MTTQITAESITIQQVRTLRREAVQAGDFAQVAICDLALAGTLDTDDYTVLTRPEVDRLINMTQDEAMAACATAINEGQG